MSNLTAEQLFQLGRDFHFGEGEGAGLSAKERELKSIECFTQAANMGHAEACLQVVSLYADETSGIFDLQKAIEWADKAAKIDHPRRLAGYYEIYGHYQYHNDVDNALIFFEKFMEGKESDSLCIDPAKWLFEGEKIPADYTKAVSYFLRADTPEADYYLGQCYEKGLGVDVDYDEALYRYTASVSMNYRPHYADDAFLRMAILTYKHKKDYEGAKIILEGNDRYKDSADALYHLGLCYIEEGLNKAKGFDYLKKAANKKHIDACIKVAQIYLEGKIVAQDLRLSAEWYAYAHKIGGKGCAIKAAQSYELMQGNFEALENAKKWYDVAAKQGDQTAKAKVAEYESNKCPHCGAFFSKTTKKVLWMTQTVCAKCGKKLS